MHIKLSLALILRVQFDFKNMFIDSFFANGVVDNMLIGEFPQTQSNKECNLSYIHCLPNARVQ